MSTVTPSRPGAPPPARPRRPAAMAAARTIDPFRLLRRHMLMLILTGFIGVGVGVGAFFALKKFYPLYSGEVLFEIRAGLNEARDVASQDITQDEVVTRLASTEYMLLASRDVLVAAVKQPDVRATAWFQNNYIGEGGVELIDEAVDDLEEDIVRRIIQGTNLFGLKWSAAVDSDVPIVLNSIARAYLDERKRLDETIYNENIDVFQRERTQTVRQLDDIGQQIEAFIREKGITSLDDPRSNQLALAMQDLVERIAETSSALNMSQSLYMQTSAKLEGTMEPSDEDRRMAQEHPAARPQEMAVLQAKTQLRQLRDLYRSDDHYSVVRAERVLRAMELEYEAKIKDIMRDNLRGQLKSLEDQIARYQNMAEELEGEYEEKSAQLRNLAADMSTYLEMEEQRGHLNTTLDSDQELIKEARLLRLRADASRVRMAQRARTPRELSFPKVEYVVPAATVLLLAMVTGLIFLRELTDQRVKSASDLFVVPDARVLGVIPELAEDPCRAEAAELVVGKHPNSVLAESYRQAYALIDKATTRLGHQTLLIVGGLPGAGTTTVVTNLAAAAAAAGRSVVIVDANFRRPQLARAMGLDPESLGLGDVLKGELNVGEAIHSTESGISVLTAGRPANRVFERLNDERFDRLMAELRSRFDLVLVDAPPAVVAGDALVMAGKVDAAVLVVRAYQEQRGLVARLMNQLSDAQCELLGLILNRPRGTAGGYFKKNFEAMARYATPPADANGKKVKAEAKAKAKANAKAEAKLNAQDKASRNSAAAGENAEAARGNSEMDRGVTDTRANVEAEPRAEARTEARAEDGKAE